MDHAAGAGRLLLHELADGLIDRLRLDIADSAADLNDGDRVIRFFISYIKPALDLIGDMGNDLYRASAIVAAALLVEDGPVYFARSDVAVVVQALIDKALVVTKVEVCLCPVVRHEDLSVLDRVHCPGIDIEVGIKLLHSHLIAA